MDFTILAVVLLIGVGIPVRNKLIRKYREEKRKKDDSEKRRGQPHKAQTNYRYHISSSSLLSFTYSRKYRTPCSTGTWGW